MRLGMRRRVRDAGETLAQLRDFATLRSGKTHLGAQMSDEEILEAEREERRECVKMKGLNVLLVPLFISEVFPVQTCKSD